MNQTFKILLQNYFFYTDNLTRSEKSYQFFYVENANSKFFSFFSFLSIFDEITSTMTVYRLIPGLT